MTTRSIRCRPNSQSVAEASEWFVEFRSGDADAATSRRFVDWLRRSPENIQAYIEVAGAYAVLPTSDPDKRIDVEAMIARVRAEQNVLALPSSGTVSAIAENNVRARTPTKRRAAFALAACVAFAAILIPTYMAQRGDVYSTDTGEQRTIRLKDGSIVELNARSNLTVRFSKHQRQVTLDEGQALFRVAKDPSRPFVVGSGDLSVRAVGTQFDVYRRASGTTVTVIEGRVAVAGAVASVPKNANQDSGSLPSGSNDDQHHSLASGSAEILLAAGEQLTARPNAVAVPRTADTAAATAWVQKHIVFKDTPLSEVAHEFNRYNTRTLVVEGEDLQGLQISGIYSSTDPASLLAFLRSHPTIAIVESPREIHITARRPE